MPDPAFVSTCLAAGAGLLASVALEQRMLPTPRLRRPWASWALHAALWLLPYSALVLALGRPWFAAAALTAFLLMLLLVSNVKFKTLREPFVFQDYEYFIDTLLHPRLYIPFFGWGRFVAAALGFIAAVALGLWVEVKI